MKVIKHWQPSTDIFIIAQPIFNGQFSVGDEILLRHPRKSEKMEVKILDHWTFPLYEVPEWLALITYGVSTKKMLSIYKSKYPKVTIETEVKFLIVKKL